MSPPGAVQEILPAQPTLLAGESRFWVVGKIQEPQTDIRLTVSFGFHKQVTLRLEVPSTVIAL